MPSLCLIGGCGKPACNKRGWCSAHYTRWIRHSDPTRGRTEVGAPDRYYREVVLPYCGDDCLTWPFTRADDGYGQISRGGRMRRLNRYVCEDAHGPAPTRKHEAAHSCGNGHLGCCNPRHLRWATHAENMAEMEAHGSQARGERLSKLSEDDARKIRSLKGTLSQSAIAAMFGIHQSQVSRIHSNARWGWLDA